MELEIVKTKPDGREFYIPNEILVGTRLPCETSCHKLFWRLKVEQEMTAPENNISNVKVGDL